MRSIELNLKFGLQFGNYTKIINCFIFISKFAISEQISKFVKSESEDKNTQK